MPNCLFRLASSQRTNDNKTNAVLHKKFAASPDHSNVKSAASGATQPVMGGCHRVGDR